jgi:deazaflavin-dependent oxidoreductase (nitroreductase family)
MSLKPIPIKDRANTAPGVPMWMPPRLERLQIKYMNPALRPIAARYLPGAAIIKHRGRKSGKPYETIVTPVRKGKVLAIVLCHGKTDWVKNVLAAGEADVLLIRRDIHITNPRLLPAGSDGQDLPWIARLVLRWIGVFVADIAQLGPKRQARRRRVLPQPDSLISGTDIRHRVHKPDLVEDGDRLADHRVGGAGSEARNGSM